MQTLAWPPHRRQSLLLRIPAHVERRARLDGGKHDDQALRDPIPLGDGACQVLLGAPVVGGHRYGQVRKRPPTALRNLREMLLENRGRLLDVGAKVLEQHVLRVEQALEGSAVPQAQVALEHHPVEQDELAGDRVGVNGFERRHGGPPSVTEGPRMRPPCAKVNRGRSLHPPTLASIRIPLGCGRQAALSQLASPRPPRPLGAYSPPRARTRRTRQVVGHGRAGRTPGIPADPALAVMRQGAGSDQGQSLSESRMSRSRGRTSRPMDESYVMRTPPAAFPRTRNQWPWPDGGSDA